MNKESNSISLIIDGQAISVPKGTTVYNAAMKIGSDVPIFCYHDRMPPFGACRMCLVEVEKSQKLQASCTLEVTEGMVVHTQSSKAIQGRKDIIELLLINHPLDCPICDRGGECPLQENALAHGPGKSHFYEEKRHFKKPIPLGPVLMLDRERCIACARCTRFGELVAGDSALVLLERGYRLEVGTAFGSPVASKFIGNTIQICPVGALTSDVYRFRARPWDNDTTESCCTLCPVGCHLYLDARDGEIMRTRACEQKNVNDIWLCDKGWFGYEFSASPQRLQKPLIRKNGTLKAVEWEEALAFTAGHIQEARVGGQVAALGGNCLSVEENFLFQKFVRDSLSSNNLDHRLGMPLFHIDQEGIAPGMEIQIGDCESLNFIILLGIDMTEEFPVIWLRLKQAINKGARAFFFGHFAPEIAPHMEKTLLHRPGKEIEFLEQQLPWLEKEYKGKGAIFVGRQYLALQNRSQVLSKLLAWKEKGLSLNLLEGSGNSMGARFAGVRPDLAPGGTTNGVPGLNGVQILEKGAREGWDLLYLVGTNPAESFPTLWQNLRQKTKFIIAQDLFLTKSAMNADVVFPSLSFVEKNGSFINIAGDVQKIRPGKALPANLRADGEIFALLAHHLGDPFEFNIRFMQALEKNKVSLKQMTAFSPQVTSPQTAEDAILAVFAPSLFDQGERMKHNPHLLQLAKFPGVRVHPEEGAKRGFADKERARIAANGVSVQASLTFDAAVASGTVVLPLGFEEYPFAEMNPSLWNGFPVTLHKVEA